MHPASLWVGLLTVIGHSGDLLQQRKYRLPVFADPVGQVTYRVAGATVEMVAAAHGLHKICNKLIFPINRLII